MNKITSWITTFWGVLTRPATIISIIGIGGFLVDMLVKPVTNAGLILLLAAAAPWILKTVKRLKVGDYLEFENLTAAESERKLEAETEEVLEDVLEKKSPSEEVLTDPAQTNVPPTTSSSIQTATPASPPEQKKFQINRNYWKRRIQLTEHLVLNWLEKGLQVPVRREVRMGGLAVDGVAMTQPVPTLVEVKVVFGSMEVGRRIRDVEHMLNSARLAWTQRHNEWPKAMIILAIDSRPGQEQYEVLMDRVGMAQRVASHDVELKVLSTSELGLDQEWSRLQGN